MGSYDSPVVPAFVESTDAYNQIKSVVGSSAVKRQDITDTLPNMLLRIANRTLDQYKNHYIVAVQATSNNLTVLYNTIPNHAAPLAISVASNIILKQLIPNKNYKIVVTNHPMRTDAKLIFGSTRPEPNHIFYATVIFEVFMPIGLALLAATFVVLPMEEKLCKAKQLQLMTGVHPMTYWGSAFLWDLIVVILVICLMLCCFPIFQSHVMYTSHGGVGVALLILLVYGHCAIIFSYFMTHFVQNVQAAFAVVTIIHIVSGLVIGVVISSLDTIGVFQPDSAIRPAMQGIGRLFPTYGAVISTTRYVETAIENGRCNVISDKVQNEICDQVLKRPWQAYLNQRWADWEYLECCEKCQSKRDEVTGALNTKPSFGRSLLDLSVPECFQPKPYILWEHKRRSLKDTEIMVPGIAQELTIMLVMSLVYVGALWVLEYRLWLWRKLKRKGVAGAGGNLEEDEDVAVERKRIEETLGTEKSWEEDMLVIQNLRKIFGGFAAVKQISFGVGPGECFGLLGVNGAGKTTTFRMLTGDEVPSSGKVIALGKRLEGERREFLKNVGYCPQFDGIIGVLTGMEMLDLFCRLRGISWREGKNETEKWLRKLGLWKSGRMQCRHYSGGMKRRLCAAIGMVGDPPIILLDEPVL